MRPPGRFLNSLYFFGWIERKCQGDHGRCRANCRCCLPALAGFVSPHSMGPGDKSLRQIPPRFKEKRTSRRILTLPAVSNPPPALQPEGLPEIGRGQRPRLRHHIKIRPGRGGVNSSIARLPPPQPNPRINPFPLVTNFYSAGE